MLRRVLKRFAMLLLAFAAVMAVALYVLYFRRTPLPSAAPHARTVPAISAIPGISACWVETAKTFSNFSFASTAGSVLVKHPAGDLLIDTGSSSHYDQEISVCDLVHTESPRRATQAESASSGFAAPCR
jgi:hypothetical protein